MSEEMIFRIDFEDYKKLKEFLEKHETKCKMRNVYQGAIGVSGTYIFTNTSIGQLKTYQCVCGEEFLMSNNI